jgi:hypothetical protein
MGRRKEGTKNRSVTFDATVPGPVDLLVGQRGEKRSTRKAKQAGRRAGRQADKQGVIIFCTLYFAII